MTKIRVLVPTVAALAAMGCQHAAPAPAPAPAPVVASAGRGAPPPTPSTPAPTDSTGQPAGRGGRGGGAAGANAEPNPRPYGQVIRGDVHVKNGLFKTDRVGAQLFYEIPKRELDKDMLLVVEIEKTPEGLGYGGQAIADRVVRWERRDNRILLRAMNYDITASDSSNPISRAVQNANYAPILRAFNVESWTADSAAVIDVTPLYTTGTPSEISVTERYRGQIDATRTLLSSVAAYPTNIEVRSDVTVNAQPAAGGAAGGGRGSAQPPTSTFLMHWSMVKLPEQPMMPRLDDARVGHFTVSTVDFSRPEQRSETRTFITRYRLECSDQKIDGLCIPKKQIVYYVDPATPTWLVPWVKKAITDWQPAFEAAGFKDAIIAKEAPTKAEDPDWSPEDARYSVIDWLPSTTENAVGPSTADPRSGEIINAHLQIYHNVMNLNRDWYWTQVGDLDPRAKTLPLPDSLQGRMMEYVIAHEIGHSLGYPHNMKASGMYPADSIRSASFVHRMGHTPSVMDYSRYNYVAQPDDHIALADLIPRVGPYDIWATHWGYAPIPGARTPDDERATLDQWAREQDSKPWLRFAADGSTSDPYRNTEAVGDADAVKSTGYGLMNIKRLVPMLIPATTKPTEDNSDLAELYGRLVGQWATELAHVAVIPGAVETQVKYGSQAGPVFVPVSGTRARAAVKFLNKNAFETPTFFLRPEILGRIEDVGSLATINSAQNRVLSQLLNEGRIDRMVEIEATPGHPPDIYPAGEYLADIRGGIWSELGAGSVRIDAYRRALQRSYLDNLRAKINPPAPVAAAGGRGGGGGGAARSPASRDVRAMLRTELKTLDGQVVSAEKKAGDAETRAHLNDVHHEIGDILNPKGVAGGE
ncbi:MAG TPA: zinc-dependent metalloprotease [Gemmatimonadales bacterium]